jgi:probable rRNA maturation factor
METGGGNGIRTHDPDLIQGNRLAGGRTRPLCDPSIVIISQVKKIYYKNIQQTIATFYICNMITQSVTDYSKIKSMRNIISITFAISVRPNITKKKLARIADIILNKIVGNRINELGIVITDDKKIKELNNFYRKIDCATDVLSFQMPVSLDQNKAEHFIIPPDNISHIGEVIISYETALRQAKEGKIKVEQEISFLVIHGILHLLNYDHEKEEDRRLMEAKQTEILNFINRKKM